MSTAKGVVLIAGGSGLLGADLSLHLFQAGWTVRWLSRNPKPLSEYQSFFWDPENNEIDPFALEDVTHIVNLAGSSIADGAWTKTRKKNIIDSRVNSIHCLSHALKNYPHKVQKIIGASAIGFYGDRPKEIVHEEAPAGKGFLADSTLQWESAYTNFPVSHELLRIGIVLAKNGGALPEITAPMKFGVAPIPGNGKQKVSWIHIHDLARLILFSLENKTPEILNAVSPYPVTQEELVTSLRKFHGFTLPVHTPEFILKVLLGERSTLILNSSEVSAQKVLDCGFEFRFPTLKEALNHLYAS